MSAERYIWSTAPIAPLSSSSSRIDAGALLGKLVRSQHSDAGDAIAVLAMRSPDAGELAQAAALDAGELGRTAANHLSPVTFGRRSAAAISSEAKRGLTTGA